MVMYNIYFLLICIQPAKFVNVLQLIVLNYLQQPHI